MVGSLYAPQTWRDVEASKVQPKVIGVKGSAAANTTTNIDTLIADDSLIRGIEFMTMGATFGDQVSISVIDKDAVYAPANTVLSIPINGYVMVGDSQKQAAYESVAPMKLLGGLYVRISYVNTALITSVSVGANFLFMKVLV